MTTFKEEKDDGPTVEHITLYNAAVEGTESTTISIVNSIKDNLRVILYSVLVDIGPLIYGYDSIVVSVATAMPAFLMEFGVFLDGQFVLPSLWIALWNAMTQLGAMAGAAATGPLSDRFGRRASMMLGGIISCTAIAIMYAADQVGTVEGRRGTFLAGKLILGFALGIFQVTSTTYMSEIAPPRIRGPLLSTFSFVLIMGQLIAAAIVGAQIVIPNPSSYRIALASQWAFAGWAIVVGIVIPESPAFFLKRGNEDAARRAMNRLTKPEFAEANLKALAVTLEQERMQNEASASVSFAECFRGTNLRRTCIVIFMAIGQQGLGVSFVSNSTYFLITAGLSPSNSINVLIIGLCACLVANVASWFLMTTVGRRIMIMVSTTIVASIWLSIAIAAFFTTQAALWYIGVMINIVLVFFHLGVGAAAPVISGETPSIRLRGITQSLGFIAAGLFSWAFNFFVPYMFNVDEGNWGAKTGFFFAGLSFIVVVVVWLFIPEMKNRTYAEIDEMFECRLKTRQFKRYKTQANLISEDATAGEK